MINHRHGLLRDQLSFILNMVVGLIFNNLILRVTIDKVDLDDSSRFLVPLEKRVDHRVARHRLSNRIT